MAGYVGFQGKMHNAAFEKNWAKFYYYMKINFYGYCFKSDMPLYKWRVTWKYAYSPFKIFLPWKLTNLQCFIIYKE